MMIDFNNLPTVTLSSNRWITIATPEAETLWRSWILSGEMSLDNLIVFKIIHPSDPELPSDDLFQVKERATGISMYVRAAGLERIKTAVMAREEQISKGALSNEERSNPVGELNAQSESEHESSENPESSENLEPHNSPVSIMDERVLSNEEISDLIRELYNEDTSHTEPASQEGSTEVQEVEETPSQDTSTESVGLEMGSQEAELELTQAAEDSQESASSDMIPLNPDNMYEAESTVRFKGAEWFEEIKKANFIVAGVGGIGSNFVYMLARLNPNTIYMYDSDMVEAVNMAGQLYSSEDIGRYKVDALHSTIRKFTTCFHIFAVRERYTIESPTGDIMVCGFDNMESRKLFFLKWRSHIKNKVPQERKSCLFIDGRLNAEMCQTFCIRGDDEYNMKLYEEQYLFDDSAAEEALCSYKQTTYCACMIGAYMTNLVVNHIANLCNPVIERDLPFFTEYDAKLMYFRTRI